MMSCTRIYVEIKDALTIQAKKKKVSKPSKAVMREHEGTQFILYHYNIKG